MVKKKDTKKKKSIPTNEIFKNHLTKIIVQRGKYKGKERVDIRQWVCIDENTDHWIPTKAGCNFPIDLLDEFQDIVNRV